MDWEKYIIGFLGGVVCTSVLGVAVVHFTKPMTSSGSLASLEVPKVSAEAADRGTSAMIFAAQSEPTPLPPSEPSLAGQEPLAEAAAEVKPFVDSEPSLGSVKESTSPQLRPVVAGGTLLQADRPLQGAIQVTFTALPGDLQGLVALRLQIKRLIEVPQNHFSINPEELKLAPGYYDYQIRDSSRKVLGAGTLAHAVGKLSRKEWRRGQRKAAALAAYLEREKILNFIEQLRDAGERLPAQANFPDELRMVKQGRYSLAYPEHWEKVADFVKNRKSFDQSRRKRILANISLEVKNKTFF